MNLRGYGHYRETYEKVDGQWRITSSKLTRLREDVFNGLCRVYLGSSQEGGRQRCASAGSVSVMLVHDVFASG